MPPRSKAPGKVGPFLKWAGGKGGLLTQLVPLLPADLGRRGYVEPFMGSAALFLHLAQTRKLRRATLLDVNPELVNAFVQVRDAVEPLMEALGELKAAHNDLRLSDDQRKARYYAVRAATPPAGSVAAAARLIYLNKTCFNGLYRLNSKGGFNVPMGSYVSPTIFEPDHLRAVSRLLQDVTIETCSFRECGRYVRDGDFVYCDPPYAPLSETSRFTSYARDGFGDADQEALRDLLLELRSRARWMLSNSTAPLVERLYDHPGLHKHYVHATRNINRDAAGRGRIPELVVTSYGVAGPIRGLAAVPPAGPPGQPP